MEMTIVVTILIRRFRAVSVRPYLLKPCFDHAALPFQFFPSVHLQSVSCDFKDNFLCGYEVDRTNPYQWQRAKSDQIPTPPSPYGQHYMVLLSNLGLAGALARLTSPEFSCTANTTFLFQLALFAYENKNKTTTDVRLLIMREGIKAHQITFVFGSSYWDMDSLLLTLGPGHYQITLEGIMGSQLLSDFAVTSIRFNEATSADIEKIGYGTGIHNAEHTLSPMSFCHRYCFHATGAFNSCVQL
jgi:hypothetical protein